MKIIYFIVFAFRRAREEWGQGAHITRKNPRHIHAIPQCVAERRVQDCNSCKVMEKHCGRIQIGNDQHDRKEAQRNI